MLKIILIAFSALAGIHPQDGPHVDIRVEILQDKVVEHVAMNLVFLDEFAPAPRESTHDIDPVELEQVGEAIAEAMRTHAPVMVNGVAVIPKIQDLKLSAVDASLLPLFPRSGMRGMRRVEFSAIYPLNQPPRTVTLGWDVFPEDLLSTPEHKRYLVISGELEAEGRRQGIEFSGDSPRVEWRAPTGAPADELLPVPAPPLAAEVKDHSAANAWMLAGVGALLTAFWLRGSPSWRQARWTQRCMTSALAASTTALALWAVLVSVRPSNAVAPLPTSNEVMAVFTPIHANLYRALDYVREEDVYDVLARSAEGPLLEDLYRQMRRSLAIEEAGGAVGRVQVVRPMEAIVERLEWVPSPPAQPRLEFVVNTRWQVEGSVSHWGHRHDRTNEYRARYTVASTPEGWRIVKQELLEEQRVDVPPEFQPLDEDGIM